MSQASSCAIGVKEGAPGSGVRRRRRTRIAVLGEFNSGKTTLVNALVGDAVLAASSVNHTLFPTVITYAANTSLLAEKPDGTRVAISWDRLEEGSRDDVCRLHVRTPSERLKRLTVIDTPGLGFADEQEDSRVRDACRLADAVIWCTPAMQAWKASEERFWLELPERVRARGVLAVTFGDQIGDSADTIRLLARLKSEAGSHFQRIVMADDCAALLARRRSMARPSPLRASDYDRSHG